MFLLLFGSLSLSICVCVRQTLVIHRFFNIAYKLVDPPGVSLAGGPISFMPQWNASIYNAIKQIFSLVLSFNLYDDETVNDGQQLEMPPRIDTDCECFLFWLSQTNEHRVNLEKFIVFKHIWNSHNVFLRVYYHFDRCKWMKTNEKEMKKLKVMQAT